MWSGADSPLANTWHSKRRAWAHYRSGLSWNKRRSLPFTRSCRGHQLSRNARCPSSLPLERLGYRATAGCWQRKASSYSCLLSWVQMVLLSLVQLELTPSLNVALLTPRPYIKVLIFLPLTKANLSGLWLNRAWLKSIISAQRLVWLRV